MKKIFFLLLITLLNVPLFANWNNTMLRIREERGRAISITVDGRKYSKISRTLTVNDLPPGIHNIKIFVYNSNGYGYRNGILVYQGKIVTKPGRIYYCTVDKNMIDIEENCCIDDYGHWNNNDNWDSWNDNSNAWNNNRNWKNERRFDRDRDDTNYYDNWNNRNDNEQWDNRQNYRDGRRNNNDNYADNNWNSFQGRISDGRYNQLLDQIRKTSFESTKANLANQALNSNSLTVEQLIGIVREFSFESTKLDFIKKNYRNVLDPKNMFLVNDVFTFQSSKDELAEFLNNRR